MKEHTARFGLGIALPVATLATGFGSWFLWRNDLPDEIATHFDGDGVADGSSSLAAVALSFGLPLGVGAVFCMAIAATAHRFPRPVVTGVAFIAGMFATLFAAILAMTIWTHRGLDSWTEAHVSQLVMLAVVALGLVGGAVAARFGAALGEPEVAVRPGDPGAPVMALQPDEQAVWVESQTVRALLVIPAIVIVGCLIARVVVLERWLSIAAPCLIALIVMAFASYRVQVDRTGLRVRSAVLPWPKLDLTIDEIEAASVIDVRPMQWGGWGYRGSLKLMKQAALVQRAGPGMRLDLTGERVFVVTTDNPDEPVALLNALVQRREPAPTAGGRPQA